MHYSDHFAFKQEVERLAGRRVISLEERGKFNLTPFFNVLALFILKFFLWIKTKR
ncbi:MAG: hypothetical protein BMS9Abin02_1998 [Anaerolineae bacterium]|nr:MAG: hypothetical protein BMS9Abin02_1998 [Anaerolineae bacterium]